MNPILMNDVMRVYTFWRFIFIGAYIAWYFTQFPLDVSFRTSCICTEEELTYSFKSQTPSHHSQHCPWHYITDELRTRPPALDGFESRLCKCWLIVLFVRCACVWWAVWIMSALCLVKWKWVAILFCRVDTMVKEPANCVAFNV